MLRRVLVGVAVVAAAGIFGWLVMSALGRILRTPAAPAGDPSAETPAVVPPAPTEPVAGPRIKATLFFGSEDGHRLVGVEQDVPLAEGTVAQSRSLVEALLSASPPPPLLRTIPEGTALRGIYVSDQQEVFVDLDAVVRIKHAGGSMQELLTVYAVVNTLLVNLPNASAVQILIDGREADTLAGHVDLRRPLRKNEALIVTLVPPQSPS
jgi:Sporulation and spore germination